MDNYGCFVTPFSAVSMRFKSGPTYIKEVEIIIHNLKLWVFMQLR